MENKDYSDSNHGYDSSEHKNMDPYKRPVYETAEEYNQANRQRNEQQYYNAYNNQQYDNERYNSQQYDNQSYGNPNYGNQSYGNSNYGNQGYGYQGYSNQAYGYQQGPMTDAFGNPLKNRFAMQLVFAIIEILLCCLSPAAMILGIIALVFAVQANTAFQLGRREVFQSKSKTANILLIVGGVVAAIAIIINVVVASLYITQFKSFFEDFESSIQEEFKEDWSDAGSLDDESDSDIVEDYPGTNDVYLPEGFSDFTYNGMAYHVPMSYHEFAQMGYSLEEGYEGYVLSAQTYESMGFYDAEGNEIGEVRISNDTQQELPLEEGVVDYIYFDNPASYMTGIPNIDLVFGNGFDMNTSYEELEEWLGTPYYIWVDTSGESEYANYEWVYYGEDKYQRIIVNYLDGVISDITFEQYDMVD